MNKSRIQSWNDLVVAPPFDPGALVAALSFQNQAGAMQVARFARSSTWLNPAKTWINPPMVTTQPGTGTTSNVAAANPYDFNAVVEANNWNTINAMTLPTTGMPFSVQNIMFLKSGVQFINNVYLDFTGAATSTDILFSMRDNSATSGNFENAATGTVPVLALPSSTYGGTGRNLAVSLAMTGRFQVALRIVDNSGNWSMYAMDWIIL